MMHPIDRVAAFITKRGPSRLRVFPGGWGDAAYVAMLGEPDRMLGDVPEIDVHWTPPKHHTDRVVRDGSFRAITDVPVGSQVATVRLIEPPPGSDRLVLLVAAWNDHGYTTREQLAAELLKLGIASLLLEIPYYGTRRVAGPDTSPIPTVADFARMGLGTVMEGRALLRHLRQDYRMGVSGYSMGGNIGAMIGAAAGFPVAMAPLAASHSPGPVFLDGVISNGIDWAALGGRNQEIALREALSSATVLAIPPPAWGGAAVLVAGRSDGFVPRSATEALHSHWPGSELRMRRGGHATLLWQQRPVLARAIADSFDNVDLLTA